MSSSAETAFAEWVRSHHGLDPERIVPRPELDGDGFHGFTAVAPGRYVRGLVRGSEVLTFAVDDAFARWVAAVDFAHVVDPDPVRFVHVYQSLQAPPEDRYAESRFPLLSCAQLATAPLDHVAERVELPCVADEDGGGRRVGVWFQAEPGSTLEHWVFHVAADGAVTLERRVAAPAR
jgi:hypothetical protein